MDLVFCTLFDSNYLDKGLVLFDSMKKTMDEFRLYVIAFDDKCYKVLKEEADERLIPIPLEEMETPELLEVKKQRTRAEYCWTCSSNSIRYVLDHYNEQICTYIDADMMFFSSPQSVFDAMHQAKCSVIIVPHRFETEKERIKARNTVGEYCVEFDTFVNDVNGRKALDWWADKCIEWCCYAVPGTTEWYGDQKYLNVFPEKFEGVYICDDYGLGLAPWNSGMVRWNDTRDGIPIITGDDTGKDYRLCLYHYESLSFFSRKVLFTPQRFRSKELYDAIYHPYIMMILAKREYLNSRYGIEFSYRRRVVTKNPLVRLYHTFITPLKRIRKRTDVYFVR